AAWAVRAVANKPWQSLRPKLLSALPYAETPTSTLDRELEWSFGLLSGHFDNITRFLDRRDEIEQEFLFGSQAKAWALANALEVECGPSFASCGLKLSLTQAVEGLEAQKRLSQEYRRNCRNGFVGYAVFMFSLRSETTTQATRFNSSIAEA